MNLDKDNKIIDSNPVLTIGIITEFYEVGISNYYLNYKYEVDNIDYTNRVMSKRLFDDCQKNDNCIGENIYIKYYKEDPTISRVIWDSLPKN